MKTKRRYIALTANIIFVLCFVFKRMNQAESNAPMEYEERFYEYPVSLLLTIFTLLVFLSKNNDTKNILTTLSVLITIIYMVIVVYMVISG
jgi:hypothetical protein